jgi:DNA-binding CsgD family transcriptional regulator
MADAPTRIIDLEFDVDPSSWIVDGVVDVVIVAQGPASTAWDETLKSAIGVSVVIVSSPPALCNSAELSPGSKVSVIERPLSPAIVHAVLVNAIQVSAIRFIAATQAALERPRVTAIPKLPNPESRRCQGLSHREKEIGRLLVSGLDTNRIAVRLRISVFTVRNHVKSLYKKMRVSSRAELLLKSGEVG